MQGKWAQSLHGGLSWKQGSSTVLQVPIWLSLVTCGKCKCEGGACVSQGTGFSLYDVSPQGESQTHHHVYAYLVCSEWG